MADINEMIKQEWRGLGFYYELEENNDFKQWRFYGSKQGLFNFISLLEDYTAKKSNDYISEHDHYGPYHYLKIMTWDKPEITENYFAGTIADLHDSKLSVKFQQTAFGIEIFFACLPREMNF